MNTEREVEKRKNIFHKISRNKQRFFREVGAARYVHEANKDET